MMPKEIITELNRDFAERTMQIRSGKGIPAYILRCTKCGNERMTMSSPIGPGGTLSCSYCYTHKINPLGLEGAYGNIRVEKVTISIENQRTDNNNYRNVKEEK